MDKIEKKQSNYNIMLIDLNYTLKYQTAMKNQSTIFTIIAIVAIVGLTATTIASNSSSCHAHMKKEKNSSLRDDDNNRNLRYDKPIFRFVEPVK
jgi:hypothetical protein